MKVFCAYNHEYDRFLKSVVDYILCKYGDDLELKNIDEIELVKELEPKLYNDVFKAFEAEDISVDLYAVYLFLEYVAERRSSVIHTKEHDEYCMAVESGSWNRYKNAPAEMAFLLMSKILVYYIVRKDASCDFKSCFGKNKLVAEYVEDLSEALNCTYSELPFDDKEKCSAVKNVMERYMLAFVEEYAR